MKDDIKFMVVGMTRDEANGEVLLQFSFFGRQRKQAMVKKIIHTETERQTQHTEEPP